MKFKIYSSVLMLFVFCQSGYSQAFTKITAGPIVNDSSTSFGSSWIDLDQDGDLDLFVSNVYFENDRLYINNANGTFTLVTTDTIVKDGKYSYNSTWGDYDNDGFEDAFITNGNWNGNQFNSFFVNNAGISFSQISGVSIVNDLGFGIGSSWADYDNDGNLDLFVTNNQNQANFLYHNNGNGSFTKITAGSIVTDLASSASCAWGDYDNDNFPDLFVSNFGSVNFLYHNNGNGTFTKITSGAIVTDLGDSHGASWGDYDNDGWLDLFVNRWSNQNDLLYHNNGNGTFAKVTNEPQVNNGGSGTGSAWGDYDNDGWLDLFVSNSSLTGSGQFNYLYHNNGNGTFTQVTTGTFPTDDSHGRGASWADYDHDGDLDLHVANEYNYGDFLYQNNGNSNHWINIKCYGTTSNKSAIGTRVSVKANINGSPVWQNNFISAQSGYSGQNSLNVEFGFGNAAIIDSMIVQWPSGLVCYFTNIPTNQFVKVYETCILTGIENASDSPGDFTIYPNPNNGEFTISFKNKNNSPVTLEILNDLGQKIYSLTEQGNMLFNKKLNSSELSLSNGIYFIKLKGNDTTLIRKFIVLD